MNISHLAAVSAVIAAVNTLVSPLALCQTPTVPVGSLDAYPTVVQTGTRPTLTWSVNYPSIVQNYVTITSPATCTPKENLVCEIRMLGLGVTSQNNNGSINYYRTRGRIKYNGSSNWTTLYDGYQTDSIVQQQGIVKSSFSVSKNQDMNFAGAYYNNSSWQTEYSSLSGDNVRTLVNGSTPPTNVPDYNAPSLEKFLRPYLDTTGKVKIGPMDVIVFMELTHSSAQKADVGYDLQDLVMLLTFRKP